MDENKSLLYRLVAAEVAFNPIPVIKSSEPNLLIDLDKLEMSKIIVQVENLESIKSFKFKEVEIIKAYDENEPFRKSLRSSKVIEKPDLGQLYHEILMSKVFEEKFSFLGATDFVAFMEVDFELDEKLTKMQNILIYEKENHLIHIASFIKGMSSISKYLVLKVLLELELDYFNFTEDCKYIILGSKQLIILFDIDLCQVVNYFAIPFQNTQEAQAVIKSGKINNFKSTITNDSRINIIYNTGMYIYSLFIKIEYQADLIVKVYKCNIEKEPKFLYINNEQLMMVAITSNEDSNGNQYIQTISVINIEDMKIIGKDTPEASFFDDIYFKFSRNFSQMYIKVIRKLKNKLFVKTISITQNSDENDFTVLFENEYPTIPGFLSKNSINFIQNSIFNSLLISYSTKSILGQDSGEIKALIDYNSGTEIKKLKNFPNGATFIEEKIFLKCSGSLIIVYSLSDLKSDPFLDLSQDIIDFKMCLPYLLVKTNDQIIHCYELLLNNKGSISPELTFEDFEYLSTKFSILKRQNILAALCFAKDSKNLQAYLEWKLKNSTSDNFEPLPIMDCVETKSFACLDILIKYILELDEDSNKMRFICDEIEMCFEAILTSCCVRVPQLLHKLFITNLEYGTPKSEFLPIYQSYDFRGSSLRGYFFGSSTQLDKDYCIKTSLIKLPDQLGSQNSLKLSSSLCEVKDIKIFGTEFIQTYIRSKWSSLWLVIFLFSIIMWSNIFTVTCVLIGKSDPVFFYLLVIINLIMACSEIIQATNLGIEKYIGIHSINYISVFQIFTCLYIFIAEVNVVIIIVFSLLQAFGIAKLFHLKTMLEFIMAFIILCLPISTFLLVYAFTSTPIYIFIVIGIIEIGIYCFSFISNNVPIGNRFGLQITGIILYSFYPPVNLYLLLFILSLNVGETGYIIKLIKYSEYKAYHTTDYLCFIIGSFLLIASYILGNASPSCIYLFMFIVYIIYRAIKIYNEAGNKGDEVQLMVLICYRYSLYLLIAHFITGISEFSYAFLFFNIFEFIWYRSTSFKGLAEDGIKLVFNWNTLDIIRYIVTAYWIIEFKFNQEALNSSHRLPNDVLTWIFAFLNLMKALLGFRAFDKTRFYLRLISRCVLEIIPFLIIFVFFTFSFGLLNVIEKNEFDFDIMWREPFDQAVGGFTSERNGNAMQYVMFLLGTLILVIVMLNLLISILGETFRIFLVEAKNIDYKVMIETIYEVEVLLFWRKWTNSVNFFASCDNIIQAEENSEEALDSKIDYIDKKLENFKSDFDQALRLLNTKIDKMSSINQANQIIS